MCLFTPSCICNAIHFVAYSHNSSSHYIAVQNLYKYESDDDDVTNFKDIQMQIVSSTVPDDFEPHEWQPCLPTNGLLAWHARSVLLLDLGA